VSDRLLSQIEDKFESKEVGEIELRGVDRAVKAHEVLGVR
jgi:class 3 adenylate cyclase